MSEITFEIKEKIGTISVSTTGWATELNIVSWNNKEAKYDLRAWSPDHTKMGKGLSFTKDEIESLKNIIDKIKK